MRAACGLSAAVSFRAEPNMWEDVCWRLCLSRWVPLFLFFLLRLCAQWCCQKDDLCKSAAKPPRASVKLCECEFSCVLVKAVLRSLNTCPKTRLWTEATTLWDWVVQQTLSVTLACCAADQWLFEFCHVQRHWDINKYFTCCLFSLLFSACVGLLLHYLCSQKSWWKSLFAVCFPMGRKRMRQQYFTHCTMV